MKYGESKEVFKEYLGLKFTEDESTPNIKIHVYSDAKGEITISQDEKLTNSPKNAFKKIYTVEKLSSKAEAALLGYFAGCCQHIGGTGKLGTIYGITHPKSHFYVVRNPKKEIVALTWVWESETGILVFDLIEFNEAVFGQKTSLLSDLFRESAVEIMRASGTKIKEVRVGAGGKTPKNCGISLSQPRQPVSPPSYSGNSRFCYTTPTHDEFR